MATGGYSIYSDTSNWTISYATNWTTEYEHVTVRSHAFREWDDQENVL
jgi:hypothetical protein